MTTFGGAVGNTTALASVTMAGGGATAINGGSIATAGAQSYGGSVTLGAATTLTGTDVTFADMVTGAHALTVHASGTTAFNTFNFVDIASLTTDAGGTTVINTNTVHTSGAQIYNDAVMLATTVAPRR